MILLPWGSGLSKCGSTGTGILVDSRIYRGRIMLSDFNGDEFSLSQARFVRNAIFDRLTARGRCLRPALYSSLRSSPSHPAGVSALRVTIAIASARFAREQGLRQRLALSAMKRRLADVFGRRVKSSSTKTGAAACCASLCIPKLTTLPAQSGGGLFKSGFEIPVHDGKTAVAESGAWCNDLGGLCHKGELR